MLVHLPVKENDVYRKWRAESYTLLNLMPCSTILAVFVSEKSPDGTCEFFSDPVDFLAVAKVETTSYRVRVDSPPNTTGEVTSREYERRIVGLQLYNGIFEVCDDASNFIGYCRANEYPYVALRHCVSEEHGTLKKPSESPAESKDGKDNE